MDNRGNTPEEYEMDGDDDFEVFTWLFICFASGLIGFALFLAILVALAVFGGG